MIQNLWSVLLKNMVVLTSERTTIEQAKNNKAMQSGSIPASLLHLRWILFPSASTTSQRVVVEPR
jgi:hypothetical protein